MRLLRARMASDACVATDGGRTPRTLEERCLDQAARAYVANRIDADELERCVGVILAGDVTEIERLPIAGELRDANCRPLYGVDDEHPLFGGMETETVWR